MAREVHWSLFRQNWPSSFVDIRVIRPWQLDWIGSDSAPATRIGLIRTRAWCIGIRLDHVKRIHFILSDTGSKSTVEK